jgi:outer membrane protein TolC
MLTENGLSKIFICLTMIGFVSGCQNSYSNFNESTREFLKSVSNSYKSINGSEAREVILTDKKDNSYHLKNVVPEFARFEENNALRNVRLAITVDPYVNAAISAIEVAEQDYEATKSLGGFQSSATISAGIVSENQATDAAAGLVLSGNKMIYDFGGLEFTANSALQNVEIAKLQALIKAEESALNGFDVWINLMKTKKILDVYQSGLQLAKPLLGQIKNISTSGISDKAALLAAQQKYAALEVGVAQAKTFVKISETQFINQFKGADLSDIDEVGAMDFPKSSVVVLDELKDSNVIAYQLRSRKALEEQISALKSDSKPKVLFASRLNAPFEDTMDEGDLNLGLQVNYKFTDGGKNQANIRKYEAQIKSIDDGIVAIYEDAENQYLILEQQYKAILKKKNSMKELQDLAHEVRDTAKAQLVSGRSNIKDVMNAEVALAEAKIELISSNSELASLSYRATALLGNLLEYVGWTLPDDSKS